MPIFKHWMKRSLCDAWNGLPLYISGGDGRTLPFKQANGMSSDKFYGVDNLDSLWHLKDLVRFVAATKEEICLGGFDLAIHSGKIVINIVGHHGKVICLVANSLT